VPDLQRAAYPTTSTVGCGQLVVAREGEM